MNGRLKPWYCISALALFACGAGSLYSPAVVRGDSMAPTLKDGALLWVDRMHYRRAKPAPGEVIVFRHQDGIYIKRVYAGPGDSFHYVGLGPAATDMVGPLRESRLAQARQIYTGQWSSLRLNRMQVPEDAVFVVGDNWDNSVDSREFGPIPLIDIIGRVRMTSDATIAIRHEVVPHSSRLGQQPRTGKSASLPPAEAVSGSGSRASRADRWLFASAQLGG